jgi:hypothetical protein
MFGKNTRTGLGPKWADLVQLGDWHEKSIPLSAFSARTKFAPQLAVIGGHCQFTHERELSGVDVITKRLCPWRFGPGALMYVHQFYLHRFFTGSKVLRDHTVSHGRLAAR